MTNHAHNRPKAHRTVVRPRNFTRTATGKILPAIPLPVYKALGRVQCTCGKRFWRVRSYRRHYVLGHIYAEALG